MRTFAEQLLTKSRAISKDLESTINARIADIDDLLSRQLNEVMHMPEFQKLESSWRGLYHFVDKSETSTTLKIRVLNASKDDLRKDLEKATEPDQSQLFKKYTTKELDSLVQHHMQQSLVIMTLDSIRKISRCLKTFLMLQPRHMHRFCLQPARHCST